MKKTTFAAFLIMLFALFVPVAGVCASAPQDGSVYMISTALNTNYVLDVYGGGIEDEANIQLYHKQNSTNQHFYLKKVDSTWYKIIGMGSNKAVDIYGNGGSKKDNLQICGYHGGSNQLFRFESAGNDYYYIKSKSGKCLDVANGRCGDEANVIAYSYHGDTNQKWRLTKVTPSPYMEIPEGTYTIHSNLNRSLVVDVESGSNADGTPIEIWGSHGGNNQKVNVVKNGSYYTLIDVNSGKAIDVNGNVAENGRKIQIWSRNSSNAQKFRFRSTLYGDGTFFIEHPSGYVWDVPNGNTTQGTKIVLWKLNQGNNQKWCLERTTAKQLDPETYYISTSSGASVYLRSGPSTSYSAITSMPNGSQISVYSISSGWAKCSYSGKTGYCSSQYISKNPPSQTYYVSTSGSNLLLRSGPSQSYGQIASMPNGSKITVYSISGGWAKCSYSGKTGYCSAQYISKSAPSSNGVTARLNSLMNQYVGTRWTGYYYGKECKGFANMIYSKLFGITYIGPYAENGKYYLVNTSGVRAVGILSPSQMSLNGSKQLLQQGSPGDYIQVHRRYKTWGHTMILVSKDSTGIVVFDCNSDGNCGVRKYHITWNDFYSKNDAMSLYHPINYR